MKIEKTSNGVYIWYILVTFISETFTWSLNKSTVPLVTKVFSIHSVGVPSSSTKNEGSSS